ncbi:MAG: penicillin-binding protein 2 [Acidobacteria bacterium]|nr:penicillin-binding protein 2 [Acidobacteriota bacterium]
MREPEIDIRRKMLWIALVLFTWMIILIWRLSWVQVVEHDRYLQKAERNQRKEIEVIPLRGSILDRNGKELALTVILDSLYADLKLLAREEDREKAARLLAPLLGSGEVDLRAMLSGDSSFVWLKRKLEPETSWKVRRAINEKGLHGLAIKQETQRSYPNDSLAAHLLGYVGAEDKGLGGLEQTQDERLRGKPGEVDLLTDASGRPFERREIPATNGPRLSTTIDTALQHKVEVLLDEALKMSGAKGASAIVLDPKNGEILAMANVPVFDPNERPKNSELMLRHNRAISFPFEPGSVFKLVTYAAVLEEGLANPNDLINCEDGKMKIGKRVIHDTHEYGMLTVADAFAQSSNIAAIKLAQRIGKEKLINYISRFGFGLKTGIELPGESRGIVNPLNKWRVDSIGSVAMGHEISVTLLQAISAMAAIANRGVWVKPHLIRGYHTVDGQAIYQVERESRRVVSEETALIMKDLLTQVVTSGTARHAIQLNGYTAAGKTGTPQKIDERTGRYSGGKYMPSFAGFVPASNPQFAIIVMIDEPKGNHYGGVVAAPVFNLIAEAALGDFAVPPDEQDFRKALAGVTKQMSAQE